MTHNTTAFMATIDTRKSINVPKSIWELGIFDTGVKVKVTLELVVDEEANPPSLEETTEAACISAGAEQ